MKKTLTIFIFTLVVLNSFSQNDPWILELPDNGALQMIQLADSSFCATVQMRDSVAFYRILPDGSIAWRTVIDTLADISTGYAKYDWEQLNNEDILSVGHFNSKPYLLKMSEEGSPLSIISLSDYPEYAHFFKIVEISDTIVWLYTNLAISGQTVIYNYNPQTETLDSIYSGNLQFCDGADEVVYSPDSIILGGIKSSYGTYTDFQIINQELDTINQKHFEFPYGRISKIKQNPYTQELFCICHYNTPQTSNGIFKLNRELDSLAYFYDNILAPVPSGQDVWIKDFTFKDSTKIAIAANYQTIMGTYPTLLINDINTGELIYGYTDTNVVPNNNSCIFRVPNGYILGQEYQVAEGWICFVVRVAEDGTFNQLPELTAFNDSIKIYPNPAEENIHIDLGSKQTGTVSLLQANGTLVTTKAVNDQQMVSIPVQGNSPGMYLIQVKTNSSSVTKKIIIN